MMKFTIYKLQNESFLYRYFLHLKIKFICCCKCCFFCLFHLLLLHNLMKARKIYKKHHLNTEWSQWNLWLKWNSKQKKNHFISFRFIIMWAELRVIYREKKEEEEIKKNQWADELTNNVSKKIQKWSNNKSQNNCAHMNFITNISKFSNSLFHTRTHTHSYTRRTSISVTENSQKIKK